ALLMRLGIGFLLGRRAQRLTATRSPSGPDQEMFLKKTSNLDFSPDLLDATINEMREGLLVIDQEMRVVASNRAARDLFSNVEDSIGARRLTELTRNPAIYDAFLDAVRGRERAGVKVETHGDGRRVFDLRVVPLQSVNGRGPSGAVGVFFQ